MMAVGAAEDLEAGLLEPLEEVEEGEDGTRGKFGDRGRHDQIEYFVRLT